MSSKRESRSRSRSQSRERRARQDRSRSPERVPGYLGPEEMFELVAASHRERSPDRELDAYLEENAVRIDVGPDIEEERAMWARVRATMPEEEYKQSVYHYDEQVDQGKIAFDWLKRTQILMNSTHIAMYGAAPLTPEEKNILARHKNEPDLPVNIEGHRQTSTGHVLLEVLLVKEFGWKQVHPKQTRLYRSGEHACPVCTRDLRLRECLQTPCNHLFCGSCILTIAAVKDASKRRCPMCRADLEPRAVAAPAAAAAASARRD